MDHEHADGLAVVDGAVLALALLAAAAYLLAASRDADRRSWPWSRTAAWLAGLAALVTGTVGPLAATPGEDFVRHAVGHLLVGMLGPLLLVLGAPVTLALRTLTPPAARRLTHLLRSRPVRVLTEPVVAAVLAVGGLWLLYTTPLLGLAERDGTVHLLVHVHLVLSGYLLPAVLVGPDPLPHRRSYRHRAAVLVAALAGHAVLAKQLYAQPPAGLDPAAVELGAMVMYYGGDAVEVLVMVLLCRCWFAVATGPRRARAAEPA